MEKMLRHLMVKLAANDQINEIFVFENSLIRGVSASSPGLYTRTCTCPVFSNIFSESTLPIKAKFHVEPPVEGGKKVYINGPGHMTKMAAMHMYGKPFKNHLL